MKKEKLELLLNKVVEYNNPEAHNGQGCNFKAFLYKDICGYYFKIVEVITGTNLSFNDIIHLNDGDENLLIVADKPKLMRVSKYSWHYQLLKYVLKSNVPTPKDMQNGCPYFWLLIFAMLVVPFIILYKGVKCILMLIPKALFFILEQLVNSWIAGLDDETAYDVYWNGDNSKMPKTAQIFFENRSGTYGNTDDNFFNFFLSKKYKDISKDDPNYKAKRQEIKMKWEVWRKDLQKRRDEQRAIESKKEAKQRERKAIRDTKRDEANVKWDAKMEPIYVGFENIGAWFRKTFTVERGRVNQVVKRTKQFIGVVVTLLILTATFFAVNYIARALMVVADWCIANWIIFVEIAIGAVIIGILYLLYILISSWGQNVINKYRRGRKLWYIEPFIYLVWYPVKYMALAIAFILTKIIWEIIKFIFYTVIFKYFLKPVGLFIGRVFMTLVNGVGNSSGIFGEYFGASYSDYCPGIEWCDFEDKDKD